MELSARDKSYRLILQSLVFVIVYSSMNLYAAVYKWTDAQGKVHYSDQKLDEKASEQTVSVGAMPRAPTIAVAEPAKYKNDRPSKWLSVTEVNFALTPADRARTNAVNFYFGGDCVTPSSMSLDEFLKRFRKNLDSAYSLQKSATLILARQGYRNAFFNPDDPKRKVDNDEGYVLKLDIVNTKINGCVPKLRSPQDSGKLSNFGFNSYEKSNVWLRLKWSIENYSGDKVFVSGFSDGSSNDYEGQNATINYTFKAAFENSFINTLASSEFINMMNPPQSIAGAAANLGGRPRVEKTADSEPAKSGLSALPGKMQNTYIARANFAKALILVNPLRMSISQYYAEHDQWPTYFSDIDVDAKHLREPGVVDSVSLRLGGRLYVTLAEEAFGPKQYFELIPDSSRQTMMDWACKTTLDKSLWMGSCIGY